MTPDLARAVRSIRTGLAKRLIGGRVLPVGRLAADRRVLRLAFDGASRGRVLVIGPGLAVRQALPDAEVDVVGTSPWDPEVTVCTTLAGPDALPRAYWDSVVITATDRDLGELLPLVVPACRRPGRVVVFRRDDAADDLGLAAGALVTVGPPRILRHRGRALLMAVGPG